MKLLFDESVTLQWICEGETRSEARERGSSLGFCSVTSARAKTFTIFWITIELPPSSIQSIFQIIWCACACSRVFRGVDRDQFHPVVLFFDLIQRLMGHVEDLISVDIAFIDLSPRWEWPVIVEDWPWAWCPDWAIRPWRDPPNPIKTALTEPFDWLASIDPLAEPRPTPPKRGGHGSLGQCERQSGGQEGH